MTTGKTSERRKQLGFRIFFYVAGLLILALGLTLNTKAGLGVSAIISVSYSLSVVMGKNFGDMTFVIYGVFVLIEIILHMVRISRYESMEGQALKNAGRTDRRLVLLMDVMQLPLSLVFTRFLNVFSDYIPQFGEGENTPGSYVLRLLVLIVAIILTGIGAAMSLNMRIIPNPGDGIVQAIADCAHKSVGFTKNCFDLLNITISTLVGLLLAGGLVGVGIGTVLAVIGVGRSIAVFNHFTYEKMAELSGVQEAKGQG